MDHVTQALVTELVVYHHHTTSYLKERCLTAFLRPESVPFLDRIQHFFEALIGPRRHFDAFLRMQVKRDILHIGSISGIAFTDQVPQISTLIRELRWAGCLDETEEERARRFFYDGQVNRQQVFIIVPDIEAEDYGKAAIVALRLLDQVIRRAKFEFEIDGFSLDNRLYLHDKDGHRLHGYTRRQAAHLQAGTHGTVTQLERLLFALSTIESNPQLPLALVEKVISFALQWHRAAVESVMLESKFLNHWFGLEQIFTLFAEQHLGGKKSAGDQLVLTLAHVLTRRAQDQAHFILWRDLGVSGLFGPAPVAATLEGNVWFNEPLRAVLAVVHRGGESYVTEEAYYDVVHYGVPIPTLTVRGVGEERQAVAIKPGMILYVDEHTRLAVGQPIAGPWLGNIQSNGALQRLFTDQRPSAVHGWQLFVDLQFQAHRLADLVDRLPIARLKGELAQYEFMLHIERERILKETPPDALPAVREAMGTAEDITRIIREALANIAARLPSPSSYLVALPFWRVSEVLARCERARELIAELEASGMPQYAHREAAPGYRVDEFFEHLWHQMDTGTIHRALRQRLSACYQQRHVLRFCDPVYTLIINVLKRFLEECTEGDCLVLPNTVITALYRNCIPDETRWQTVLYRHTEDLCALVYDQPLLAQRIQSFKQGPTHPTFDDYLVQLDRLRRCRNMLVHEPTLWPGLELMVQRLYQYSRVYLQHVIHRLATAKDPTDLAWLVGFKH